MFKILLVLFGTLIVPITPLKKELLEQGTLVLQPKLQDSIVAAVDIYVDHLFGENPFLAEYFGPPEETIQNVLKIFFYQEYSDELLNEAFDALEITYENWANLTSYYPITFQFLMDINQYPRRFLAMTNTIMNDYAKYASNFVNMNLPASLSLIPYSMAEEDVYNLLYAGSFSKFAMDKLWENLGITVTDFCDKYNVSSLVVNEFAEQKTNNFSEVMDIMGITNEKLKNVLYLLEPREFLYNDTIVGGLEEFFEQFISFGSFIAPHKVITHKDARFLDVYRNMVKYCDLWGRYPPTGNQYHMVINETLYSSWIIELNTEGKTKVGEHIYVIEKTYNANSYQVCQYPYLDDTSEVGFKFAASTAVYNETDNTLAMTKASIPRMVSDGTPLICRDALYAIGALSRETNLDYLFDSLQHYVKIVNFIEPITDLVVGVLELSGSTLFNIDVPGMP